jgi:tetratricopeptide (TPR) repeat protein
MRKAAGDRAGAAALLRRALEKAQAVDGKEGPTAALILNALALVVEPKEAIALLQRALAIDRQELGRQSAPTLRDVRKLASLLRAAGRATEAAQLEREFMVSAAH